jgi:hypothetical protein
VERVVVVLNERVVVRVRGVGGGCETVGEGVSEDWRAKQGGKGTNTMVRRRKELFMGRRRGGKE